MPLRRMIMIQEIWCYAGVIEVENEDADQDTEEEKPVEKPVGCGATSWNQEMPSN